MLTHIAQNISYFRELAGLDQVALAQIMHVGRSTISNYERDVTLPDAAAIAHLCQYFDISADYMIFVDLRKNNVLLDKTHKAYNLPDIAGKFAKNLVLEEAPKYNEQEIDCLKLLEHTREILAAKQAHIAALEKLVSALEKK